MATCVDQWGRVRSAAGRVRRAGRLPLPKGRHPPRIVAWVGGPPSATVVFFSTAANRGTRHTLVAAVGLSAWRAEESAPTGGADGGTRRGTRRDPHARLAVAAVGLARARSPPPPAATPGERPFAGKGGGHASLGAPPPPPPRRRHLISSADAQTIGAPVCDKRWVSTGSSCSEHLPSPATFPPPPNHPPLPVDPFLAHRATAKSSTQSCALAAAPTWPTAPPQDAARSTRPVPSSGAWRVPFFPALGGGGGGDGRPRARGRTPPRGPAGAASRDTSPGRPRVVSQHAVTREICPLGGLDGRRGPQCVCLFFVPRLSRSCLLPRLPSTPLPGAFPLHPARQALSLPAFPPPLVRRSRSCNLWSALAVGRRDGPPPRRHRRCRVCGGRGGDDPPRRRSWWPRLGPPRPRRNAARNQPAAVAG